MMETILGLVGTGLLGVIAWAFNLQSRVSVLEEFRTQAVDREAILKELIDVKLENISERLKRIEFKLDR